MARGGEAAAADLAEIGHVAVKLPQFWTSDPDAWFLQSEACFRRARVTDELTKFDHVVMQLPKEILSHFKDLIRNPGETPYETLKSRLIKDFTPPTWDAMWNIIQHPDLSDQSPSTLLATLLGMIPTGEKPDKWFQALYLLKLPSELRGPLSALKWEDVRQMGEHADILWGAHRRNNNTSSTHHVDVPIQASRESRSPSRNKRTTRRAATPKGKYCSYHSRFGKKARNCEPGCTWKSGNGYAADDSE